MKKYLALLLVSLILSACNFTFTETGETIYIIPDTGLHYVFQPYCIDLDPVLDTMWHIRVEGPETRRYDIYTAYTRGRLSGVLTTPGTYTVTEWTDDGTLPERTETIALAAGEDIYYGRVLCGATNVPFTYYVANNCENADPSDSHANTTWHWSFQMMAPATYTDPMLEPVEVVLPVGESASGEMPGGIYAIRDWTENLAVDHALYIVPSSSVGYIWVNLCADQPSLPDAPVNPNQ